MPIRTDDGRVRRHHIETDEGALRGYVDETSEMLRLARQERRLNYTQLARLCDGYSIAANTIKNYEDALGSRANISLMNLCAIALALQYDLRAMLRMPPYNNMDMLRALREGELEPKMRGTYWPQGWGDPPEGCPRYEIFEQSAGLSSVVIKAPGARAVDPRDRRTFVRGDHYAAWNVLVDMLRADEHHLSVDEARRPEGRIVPMVDEGYTDYATTWRAE
jgi:transcriptional regulator with XRE-family HTH domain